MKDAAYNSTSLKRDITQSIDVNGTLHPVSAAVAAIRSKGLTHRQFCRANDGMMLAIFGADPAFHNACIKRNGGNGYDFTSQGENDPEVRAAAAEAKNLHIRKSKAYDPNAALRQETKDLDPATLGGGPSSRYLN